MTFRNNLKGEKFGKLIAEEYIKTENSKSYWKCLCDCGNEKIARSDALKNSTTTHCGCEMSFENIRNRIFDKNYIIKENGCWEWKSNRDKGGYPKIAGTTSGHRYSFERYIGKIPKGKLVCHSCDNRGCVNPDHLFLGNHKENMDDCCKKNRQARGEKTASSKLTEKNVGEINRLYNEGNITQKELGIKFGVTLGSIHRILAKRSWKHV